MDFFVLLAKHRGKVQQAVGWGPGLAHGLPAEATWKPWG